MSEADDEFTDEREDGEDVTCRRCGAKGLIWERQGARWVLTTLGGSTHQCPSKRVTATEEFKEFLNE